MGPFGIEPPLELRDVVQCALLIVRCSLLRKESRGLQFTQVYPHRDDEHWLLDPPS